MAEPTSKKSSRPAPATADAPPPATDAEIAHDPSPDTLPEVIESPGAPATTDGVRLVVHHQQTADGVDLSAHVDGELVLYRGQEAKVSAAEAKILIALRDDYGVQLVEEAPAEPDPQE